MPKKLTAFLLIIFCGYTAYPVDSIFNTLDRIEVAKGLTSKTPEELEKRFGKAANLQKKRRLAAKLTIPLSFLGMITCIVALARATARENFPGAMKNCWYSAFFLLHALISSDYIRQSKKREVFLRLCEEHSPQLHALLTDHAFKEKNRILELETIKKKLIKSEITGLATQLSLSGAFITQHLTYPFHETPLHYIRSIFLPIILPMLCYSIKPSITASSRRRNKLPNLTMIFSKHIRTTNFNIKKEAYLEELANRFPSYMKKDAVAA
ncbi:MAG: hypothetical protein WCJ17_04235 [bacterium]